MSLMNECNEELGCITSDRVMGDCVIVCVCVAYCSVLECVCGILECAFYVFLLVNL